MIQVAIVEDDAKDAAVLREFLERYGREQGEDLDLRFFSDAFDFVSDYRPEYDIIFFDIEMPRMDGMEGADFLVKPLRYERFTEKITRAIRFSASRRSAPILVGTEDGGFVRILCSDVCYAEKQKNYVLYHCRDGRVYSKRQQLHEASELLCRYGFAYVNSGCLVNYYDVSKLTQTSLTVCGEELPLARRRRQEFLAGYMRWLDGRTGKGGLS